MKFSWHLDRKSIAAFLFALLAATCTVAAASGDDRAQLREVDLRPLDGLVRYEIELGRIPGAVIEIGQGGRVVYRQAFGDREIGRRRIAMSADTIFDLASLTKPVATRSRSCISFTRLDFRLRTLNVCD